MECVKCRKPLQDDFLWCPYCGKKQAAERKHRKRANNTGTIYKREGNLERPWIAKKNNTYIGAYKTRAEAQKALERLTDTTINEKYNLTFAQVYEAWKPIHERKVSPSQMSCYTMAYNNCTDLHDRQFRKLRKSDFQGQIIRMEEAGKSKSACEKMKQLFSQLSKYALSEEIIQTNYAQNLSTAAKQLSTKEVFLDADIRAIRESENRGKDIVLILISCGCRPNELFNALLINCHDDYFIGGSKTKSGKDRPIMISPDGLAAYQSLRQKAIENKGKKLIDGFDGNRNLHNFTKREFKDLMQEIGRPDVSMYSCRHTYITNAVRCGVDQRVLQQIIGHVDSETTKLYTHLNVDDLREQTQKIRTLTVVNILSTSKNEPEKLMQKSS